MTILQISRDSHVAEKEENSLVLFLVQRVISLLTPFFSSQLLPGLFNLAAGIVITWSYSRRSLFFFPVLYIWLILIHILLYFFFSMNWRAWLWMITVLRIFKNVRMNVV